MYVPEHVATSFQWQYGGRSVYVCGSFTGWQEMVPLTLNPHTNIFHVVINVPPGYHQFKFYVDGEWRHDDSFQNHPSPFGAPNNWILVRRQDGHLSDALPSSDMPDASAAVAAATLAGGGAGGSHIQYHAASAAVASAMSTHPLHSSMEVDSNASSASFLSPPYTAQAAAAVAAANTNASTAPLQTKSMSMPMNMSTASAGSSMNQLKGIKPMTPSQSSTPVSIPESSSIMAASEKELENAIQIVREVMTDFLSQHTVYSLVPESSRVTVIDDGLPMVCAFQALAEQGATAACVFDQKRGNFVSMLGAADFVRVFHEYQYLPSVINEGDLADYTVRKWRELASQSAAGAKSLISCTPDETILSLLREFVQSNLTRIPVLSIEEAYSIQDTSTIGRGPESQGKGDGSSRDKIDDSLEPAIIHLATVSDILACISLHFERILESLPLLDLPIGALSDHIGTWGNVASVTASSTLAETLFLLTRMKISSVPVLDKPDGALLDVYSRADILSLGANRYYATVRTKDVIMRDALSRARALAASHPYSHHNPDRVPNAAHTCARADSLREIIRRLAVPNRRRLIVIEYSTRKVEGIITDRDVSAFLTGIGYHSSKAEKT